MIDHNKVVFSKDNMPFMKLSEHQKNKGVKPCTDIIRFLTIDEIKKYFDAM